MVETVRIDGLAQLERNFRDLVPAIQGKKGIIQNPLRKAARAMTIPLVDSMKQHAQKIDDPETRTNIAASIGIRLIPIKERDVFTARGDSLEMYEVGPRKKGKGIVASVIGPQQKGSYLSAWYAHFVELGTEKQPAQPFMRPAAMDSKDKSTKAFMTTLSKDLKRIADWLGNRNKPRR